MKKTFSLFVIALLAISFCQAQYTTQKVLVAIGSFTGSNSANVETFRSHVLAAMPACRVNSADYEALKAKGEEASADYIVEGSLGEMTFSKRENKITGRVEDYAVVKYNLYMKDAMTGNQVSSESGESSWYAKTQEEAAQGALVVAESSLRSLINGGCKIHVKVLEATEFNKKGDKAEIISVDGGSSIGITRLLWFDIQIESEISGRKTYKTIGSANVKEVAGDDISLLNVRKGGKDIANALKEGKTVVVTSRKPNLLEQAIDLKDELVGDDCR